jgi:endoglucanase
VLKVNIIDTDNKEAFNLKYGFNFQWTFNWEEGSKPEPVYPDNNWDGRVWNKNSLREFYKPWLDTQEKGVEIHIGEFGCYEKTPNDVALRWLSDMLSLYKEFKWGYSLWNFEGEFGIIGHGRPCAAFEMYKGYRVDRLLLELLIENRVQPDKNK